MKGSTLIVLLLVISGVALFAWYKNTTGESIIPRLGKPMIPIAYGSANRGSITGPGSAKKALGFV